MIDDGDGCSNEYNVEEKVFNEEVGELKLDGVDEKLIYFE